MIPAPLICGTQILGATNFVPAATALEQKHHDMLHFSLFGWGHIWGMSKHFATTEFAAVCCVVSSALKSFLSPRSCPHVRGYFNTILWFSSLKKKNSCPHPTTYGGCQVMSGAWKLRGGDLTPKRKEMLANQKAGDKSASTEERLTHGHTMKTRRQSHINKQRTQKTASNKRNRPKTLVSCTHANSKTEFFEKSSPRKEFLVI